MIGKIFVIISMLFPSCGSLENNSIDNETVTHSAVAAALSTGNAIIIDARPEFQYRMGHIPHAINIPFDSNLLPVLIGRHALQERRLIVYCSSRECDAAEVLAGKLRELGCRNVAIYPGGWEEWLASH